MTSSYIILLFFQVQINQVYTQTTTGSNTDRYNSSCVRIHWLITGHGYDRL